MNKKYQTSELNEALEEAGINPDSLREKEIDALAQMSELAYFRHRTEASERLHIPLKDLDRIVKKKRAEASDGTVALPHWKVEPWGENVPGAELLDGIRREFKKYIVMPAGAGDALALWVLHAWTIDAGDISPFVVLVSPTKRCGKTSALIILLYLTPRSELASNISPSAVFRYVELAHPTLLMDEADSAMKDNEEMRNILNSAHTRAAAYVVRNEEKDGKYVPRRFSTWCPKAIATIRSLADTLEDRSITVTLQRKPKTAKVARLRKRDNDEFAILRRKVARWAVDNSSKLEDPDPSIPDVLNDRAADNWRPLLAIADLAGGEWPHLARSAACVLSGEGHDVASANVRLLGDIREAFGELDAIRTVDLLAKLTADPERPWVEWRRGQKLTPKQLGGLLADFRITSETVSVPGLPDAKGYKRVRFDEAWEAYLPGQNSVARQDQPSEASKRRNADGSSTTGDFRSVGEGRGDGSKNGKLSYSHAGSDVSTAKTAKPEPPPFLTGNLDPTEPAPKVPKKEPPATSKVVEEVSKPTRPTAQRAPPPLHAQGESLPDWMNLNLAPEQREAAWQIVRPRERLGPPAISSGPGDDMGDI
jgi:putative DNA primase/helicase